MYFPHNPAQILAKTKAFGYTPAILSNIFMTKTCVVTGKKITMGFNVSHSKRHTKKILRPNQIKRSLLNPATGRMVTVVVSSRGLRTLKKWQREGKVYNLAEMAKKVL